MLAIGQKKAITLETVRSVKFILKQFRLNALKVSALNRRVAFALLLLLLLSHPLPAKIKLNRQVCLLPGSVLDRTGAVTNDERWNVSTLPLYSRV